MCWTPPGGARRRACRSGWNAATATAGGRWPTGRPTPTAGSPAGRPPRVYTAWSSTPGHISVPTRSTPRWWSPSGSATPGSGTTCRYCSARSRTRRTGGADGRRTRRQPVREGGDPAGAQRRDRRAAPDHRPVGDHHALRRPGRDPPDRRQHRSAAHRLAEERGVRLRPRRGRRDRGLRAAAGAALRGLAAGDRTCDWANSHRESVRHLLEAFADTDSKSLQQTLYAMGQRVLDHRPEVVEVRLSLPNRHHFLVDLAPFGLDNPGEVFFAADRPYGLIEGTVLRDDAPPAGLAWW